MDRVRDMSNMQLHWAPCAFVLLHLYKADVITTENAGIQLLITPVISRCKKNNKLEVVKFVGLGWRGAVGGGPPRGTCLLHNERHERHSTQLSRKCSKNNS